MPCVSHWFDLDYSSPGCTGSTAPMPCIQTHHIAARLLVVRLHWLSLCTRTPRLATRLLVARCTGSTAPIPCIRTRRLAAQLLVGRSHWLSPCAWSLPLAARLCCRSTCCPVALALHQPCRALRLLVSRQHRLYFEYAACHRDIVFRLHRVNHSSRLVFQTNRERQSRPQQLVRINFD
jgi:hypothetical protein